MQKIAGRICILGAGNIGGPIGEGILSSGISNQKIILTRKSGQFSREQQERFECMSSNVEAVKASDIVIIAVQPKQADTLLSEINEVLTEKHILISVVSGLKIERMEKLVPEISIARAMPNIAIKVRQSMTCLASNEAGKEHQALVECIFRAVGVTLLIPEELFPEATVLCGSGTALVQKFIRALMQAGILNGFGEEEALFIARQVTKGSAMLLEESGSHPEVLIDKVTTRRGCTIALLAALEHFGFSSAILKAVEAGIEKAKNLYS